MGFKFDLHFQLKDRLVVGPNHKLYAINYNYYTTVRGVEVFNSCPTLRQQYFSLSLITIVLPWVPSIFCSFVIVDMEPHFF